MTRNIFPCTWDGTHRLIKFALQRHHPSIQPLMCVGRQMVAVVAGRAGGERETEKDTRNDTRWRFIYFPIDWIRM